MAKEYTQQEGLDFIETFSLVAKLVTVKVLLAIAVANKRYITQLDVNNAFLNGDLFKEIYMDLPLGYNKQADLGKQREQLVYRPHKSIYDLKQVSKQWFSEFSNALILHGFHQSKSAKRPGNSFVLYLSTWMILSSLDVIARN